MDFYLAVYFLQAKDQAWRDLAQDFNAQTSHGVRQAEQLKACWNNIKKNARKNLAIDKVCVQHSV